jgi:hypothetical protein
MHRQTVLLLLAALLASSCTLTPLQPKKDSAQKALRTSLIGTWRPDPKFEPGPPSKSTYRDDGTLEFIAYGSALCEVVLKANGVWHVEDRELHILIQASDRTDILPAPLVIVDEVLSINESSKVLRDKDDGTIQHRIRSDVCARK